METIKPEELMNYINTLSSAHAAGHKCDREIRKAIEFYTASVGIDSLEKQMDKAINSKSDFKAYSYIMKYVNKLLEKELITNEQAQEIRGSLIEGVTAHN